MSDNSQLADLRASFFVECEELVEAAQDALNALKASPADSSAIHALFRAVHSIKGNAAAFGLDGLVEFAHGFETSLDLMRSAAGPIGAGTLDLLFRSADLLADLLRVTRDGLPLPDAEMDALLDALDAHRDGALDGDAPAAPEPSAQAQRHFEITFVPDDDLFATGNEPFKLLENLAALGNATVVCDTDKVPALDKLSAENAYLSWRIDLWTDIDASEIVALFEFVEGLCRLNVMECSAPALPDSEAEDAPEDTQEAPPPAPPLQSAAHISPRSIVRVDLERIERLVNLVGELVINQSMLSQSLETAGLSPHSDAMHGLEEFQRLTRDIQDSVMMIRAQPVKSLFHRMARIVREASAAAGKQVVLVTSGEMTEIDKTVIEQLADPLTHMLRNAIDHGIEKAEMRAEQGKPEEGVVRLSAAHRSGRVILTIEDDGGGINRAKVHQIAVEEGLIAPDAFLTPAEIDNLLFLPGFSTSDEISSLSGRGVGMDVVRSAIQDLGGRIAISSTPGAGTKFTISLPLTLAVLEGMIVDVAGEPLVLPLNVISETLTLDETNVDSVQPGFDVVRVRGQFIPLLDLGFQLGYRPKLTQFVDRIVLLITLEDGTRLGLIVDTIHDQRQVVIKGLDESFHRAAGIAAATILGDGQIALILDPTDFAPRSASAVVSPLKESA